MSCLSRLDRCINSEAVERRCDVGEVTMVILAGSRAAIVAN